ncbi:MAG: phage terminase large subunit family protein [Gemmatimonadaceae bacterium]
MPDPAPLRQGLRTHSSAKQNWRSRRRSLFAAIFAPPPRLTVSQWADQFRYLSQEASASPGRWTTDMVPYLREPMDAISDPELEDLVVMKAAQLGATEALVNNPIGYFIDLDPSPILVVQPSDGEAQKYSKEKLAPMLRDSPSLAKKVHESKSRDSDSTILSKAFRGGHLGITGAQSPLGLRSRTRRVAIFDEVDGYPASAGAEGDPIMLGEKRTVTFWNRKKVKLSTPTIRGISRIEKAYADSDQRKFFVACPHCGREQVLVWGGKDLDHGMKWEPGKPETAHYVCESCLGRIDESEKARMVRAGRWIPQNPGHKTRGYHMNALISLFDGARWSELAKEFLAVKHDPLRLRVFVNTVLAETWEDAGQEVEAHVLFDRMHAYAGQVPAGVGVLCRGVDVQGDRLEVAVWGFGAGEEAWPIETDIIIGDPSIPLTNPNSPWRVLDEHIMRTYTHESGAQLRARVTLVDSGGHHTSEVYEYGRKRRGNNVFASKGSPIAAHPIVKPVHHKHAQLTLVHVGVFAAKETLLSRLAKILEPGPGYVHIPDWMDQEHLEQLTAEKLFTKLIGGVPKRVWLKKRDRNEQLDLFVLAYACLHQLGPKLRKELGAMAAALSAFQKPDPAGGGAPTQPTPKGLQRRILSRGVE